MLLDMLAPAERVSFVLHDMFDLSFEEIAPLVDRTPAAARQLASRARRRVRLLAVLSPEVVLRADELAVRTAAANPHGAPRLAAEVRGAQPGAVWAVKGQVRVAFVFAIAQGKIISIDLFMEPAHLAELDVEIA